MTFTYANSNKQDKIKITCVEINMFRTHGSKHKPTISFSTKKVKETNSSFKAGGQNWL